MKAVEVGPNGGTVRDDFPIPKPGENEVLIKVEYCASNPKDWKYPKFLNIYQIEGNDIVGEVFELGEGVTTLKKGDRVAAFTKMNGGQQYGAYAEYAVAPAWTTFKLDPSVKSEVAVTTPLAFMTAALGLFKNMGLKIPNKETIVVNGASSSVGNFVVQLAKIAGMHVIGIAGAGSDYAKEAGADEVIDYRNENIVEKLKGREVHYVYDAVSTDATLKTMIDIVSPHDSHIAVVIPQLKVPEGTSSQIKVHHVYVGDVHDKEDGIVFGTEWYQKLGQMLKERKITHRYTVLGGLDKVDEGLKMLEQGKVSATKLVYKVA